MADHTTPGPGGAIEPLRSVALVGFMGAGKTEVGRRVAARLGWRFVDLDEALAARTGRPAAALLATEGEEWFRRAETELLAEVAGEPDARVIATGGGIVLSAAARNTLRSQCTTVFLRAPLGVLEQRAVGRDRPLWDERVEARLAERLPHYEASDHTVDATRGPAEVADEIATRIARHEIAQETASGTRTRAVVELRAWEGLASALGDGPAFLVTEANVAPLWSGSLRAEVPALAEQEPIVLPAGEAAKTADVWRVCVDALIAAGIERGATVVALGGGALGDVAGFAAATVLRGVPWVVLPTTLLAMADSSLGGKTAIDHPRGKNLVGAFHAPRLVWAALPTLGTLPRADLRAGLAEVVKTALVADAGLLPFVERHAERLVAADPAVLMPVVHRCLDAKARIVAADERDAGRRVVLNVGHTVGHAVEHATGCRHGEAVAIGLVAELRFAAAHGFCRESSLPDRVAKLLADLSLPTDLPAVEPARLAAAAMLDKKRTGDMLVLPLVTEAGRADPVRVPLSAAVGMFGR